MANPQSWRPEVKTSGEWTANALRFATKAEAEANAKNLMWRWTLVTDYRAVESDDPVNYRWDAEKGLIDVSEANDGT